MSQTECRRAANLSRHLRESADTWLAIREAWRASGDPLDMDWATAAGQAEDDFLAVLRYAGPRGFDHAGWHFVAGNATVRMTRLET